MMAVTIKDLEMQIGNPKLPLGKKAIRFEPLIQKKGTDDQTAGTLYYK